MDAFSYLSVLLSIILGLAITQVLQGLRGLMLGRAIVSFYWPCLLWAALMLLIATQVWWASFGLADHRDWTFASFAILLLETVIVYLMAAVVLPDVPAGAAIDLRAHYEREAKPFFALTILLLATSLGKDWVIDGRLPVTENLAFHGLFAAIAVVGILSRRARVHEALAIVAAMLLVGYIALLFSRLS